MKEYSLLLLGFCLGFGLSGLLAAGKIQRPAPPAGVAEMARLPQAPESGLPDFNHHYDR